MTAPKTTPPVDADSPRAGVTSPYRCANPECGHLDVFHAFNTKNTARTACTVSTGRKAMPCECKTFTELLEETPHA